MTTKTIRNMQALLRSAELPSNQRSKIDLAAKSARKVRRIAFVAFMVATPPVMVFAALPEITRHSYTVVTINSILMSSIALRHALISLIMSRNVTARQSDGRTMTANDRFVSGGGQDPAAAAAGKQQHADDSAEDDDNAASEARTKGGNLVHSSETPSTADQVLSQSPSPSTTSTAMSSSPTPLGITMRTLGRRVPARYHRSRGNKKNKRLDLMTRVTEENSLDRSSAQDDRSRTHSSRLQRLASGDGTG